MYMEKSKSIDLTFLKTFTSGDKVKMSKYINMFLKHAPVLLSAIQRNLQESNWSDLKIAAHSLKPQLKYMGIGELESIVILIEQMSSEEKRLDKLPSLIDQLNTICQKAMTELKMELEMV